MEILSGVGLTSPRSQEGALKPASAVLSVGFRPLGSCPRAAGWSAATLCVGTKRTNRAALMMSVVRGRPEVTFRAVRTVFDPLRTSLALQTFAPELGSGILARGTTNGHDQEKSGKTCHGGRSRRAAG